MVAFTTALRLGLPTIGGDYNEWGGYLNETISLLEQAITGIVAIDLTGLTTYTLSTNDNEVDEARNATLRFIGTPTATVAIRIPSSAKQYYVRNDTSKTVTFATLGNAAVSVDAGFAAIVTTDGTTCYVSLLPTENWLFENFIRADGNSQALILTRYDTSGNATKDQIGISCGRDNNASTGALFLNLAVTDGTTVTSTKLYQNGTLVFPNGSVAMTINPSTSVMMQAAITATVTDFTKNYLLGASQADGRYVQKGGGPNDYAPLFSGVQKATGRIWTSYQNNSGTIVAAFAATPADLTNATSGLSSAITTETNARIAADALNAKLSGGNSLFGNQSVSGALTVTGTASIGSAVEIAAGGYLSIADSHGAGSMYSWPEYYASGNLTGINAVTHLLDSGGNPMQWMALRGSDGSVFTSAGKLAFTSQLPFLDTSFKEQVFTQTQTPVAAPSSTSTVSFTFPTAFAVGTVPYVTLTIDDEPSGQWQYKPRVFSFARDANGIVVTNTGFTISVGVCAGADVWATGLPVTAQIIAVGKF